MWQDFDPPHKFDISASAQQLSRASGCFLEGLPDGKVRISIHPERSSYLPSDSDMVSRKLQGVPFTGEEADNATWHRGNTTFSPFLLRSRGLQGVKVPLIASTTQHGFSIDRPDTYGFYPFFSEMPIVSSKKQGNFRLRRVSNWLGDEESIVFNDNDGNTRSYLAPGG